MPVLSVALAVALIALVLLWWRWHDDVALADASREATVVAEQRAVQITTYSAETLDTDFGWVDDGATPEFADRYTRETESLREIFAEVGAQAEGRVTASAATADSTDRVEVLLFVDQQIRTADGATPDTEENRVIVTMVKVDGRWLVDDVVVR